MITPAAVRGQVYYTPPANEQGLADYHARRAYAFALGEELALQRKISADAYLFLYKELVRLCKDRTSCWAGVAWMSERLGVSEGTIKRWLRQLVQAGLIERTLRSGGDTALTRIPALVAYDAHSRQTQTAGASPCSPDDQVSLPEVSDSAPSQLLFFAPEKEIKDESRNDSDLIRPSIKRQKRISGLVGNLSTSGHKDSRRNALIPPEMQSLTQIGVCGPGVLDELKAYPRDEIAAVCRYVAQQRNSYNPAGLAVFLTRSGFGRTLLRPKSGRSAAGAARRASLSLPSVSAPGGSDQAGPKVGAPRPFDDLWTGVQARLAQRVPAHEFATWLQETQLVALDDERAVVGVPNIFAREQVQATYACALRDAIAELAGRNMEVEVVIDRSG